MSIPSLDLFTGIAGFAFALRTVARPVAYCEIDPTCQRLLRHKMQKMALPTAPVFPDVRLLRGCDVPGKPRLITAGFPCQDISSQNNYGRGLAGSRSGLVNEVLRLVRELPSVTLVFMENSPMIEHKGLHILDDAFGQLGFRFRWEIISASACGAPHQRRRWWCVASRECIKVRPIPIGPSPWKGTEPCLRLVDRKNAIAAKRTIDRRMIQLLGSAVVPLVVQVAWNRLLCPKHPLPVFSPVYTPLTLRQGKVVFKKATWATPLHNSGSSLTQNNVLTFRASNALSNQIYHDEKTLCGTSVTDHKLCELFDINVCFIEYLMGYPLGYTRV